MSTVGPVSRIPIGADIGLRKGIQSVLVLIVR